MVPTPSTSSSARSPISSSWTCACRSSTDSKRLDCSWRGRTLLACLSSTTFDSDDYVFEALRAGADGFVLKRAQPEELIRAVYVVASGEVLLYPQKVREMAAEAGRREDLASVAQLSDREQEVLSLMARGLSNVEIAGELFLGSRVVKTYVSSLLGKLGARDRTQAVIRAFESGFITPLRGMLHPVRDAVHPFGGVCQDGFGASVEA